MYVSCLSARHACHGFQYTPFLDTMLQDKLDQQDLSNFSVAVYNYTKIAMMSVSQDYTGL